MPIRDNLNIFGPVAAAKFVGVPQKIITHIACMFSRSIFAKAICRAASWPSLHGQMAPSREDSMRRLFWLPLIAWAFCSPSPAQEHAAPHAVPVTTVAAEAKPVSETKDFAGRVEAIDRVEIRARVTGYLEAMLFKEGESVKEGQPLYRIEQDLFKAAVEQSQGALEASKASKKLSKSELDRANELLASSYGTPQKRDQALAADETAAANILTAGANLDTARINLGYTEIKSPIAGKIGRTKITRGNVVSPDSGVLTTVVSQDPMYVNFPVSQREFMDVEREAQSAAGRQFEVSLQFSDRSVYGHKGRIDFVDVSVDKFTDTVMVRASIPNPDGILIDGQFVQVRIGSDSPQQKIVIPESALLADQQGTYVFVADNGKAAVRRVKVGTEAGANVTIDTGLKAGELVIVEGLQSLRPGAPVLASPLHSEARS
jgi:membrane fusion protein, multidrug efflux system